MARISGPVNSITQEVSPQTSSNPVIDAAGRIIQTGPTYVWTKRSVMDALSAAFSSGFIPESRIIAFFETNRGVVHAAVQNKKSKAVAVYAIDPETARPFLVKEARFSCEAGDEVLSNFNLEGCDA